ncbi:MAG: hypothetical protein WKF90_01285 [Pyrinomonadaceae bacterium]
MTSKSGKKSAATRAQPPRISWKDHKFAHVRSQLSPLATPREIEFYAGLPKTRSGKIRRDKLRGKKEFDKENVFVIE